MIKEAVKIYLAIQAQQEKNNLMMEQSKSAHHRPASMEEGQVREKHNVYADFLNGSQSLQQSRNGGYPHERRSYAIKRQALPAENSAIATASYTTPT